MAKYIRYSFAVDGDRVPVDDSTQPSGVVSLQSGYPSAYSLIPTNPLAKKIERNKFNEIMFLVTDAVRQYQGFGAPQWIPASENGGVDFEYQKGARLLHDGNVYVSLEDNNTDEPPSDKWWLEQVQYHYGGTATGTADAMIVTAPTVLAYTDGMMIRVNAPVGGFSTVDSPTININSLGVKTICDSVGRALGFGDVQGLCVLVYSSTFGKFVLENPRYGSDRIGRIHYTYDTDRANTDIYADGAVYLRSDFPVLVAYIFSNPDYYVGEGFWSTNKGKFSTGDGTTNFRAPLIEGRFLRALDRHGSVDPGRAFASEQDCAIENITGELGIINGGITSTTGAFSTNGTTDNKIDATFSGTTNRVVFDASTVVNTATETRPVNMAYFVSIRAI